MLSREIHGCRATSLSMCVDTLSFTVGLWSYPSLVCLRLTWLSIDTLMKLCSGVHKESAKKAQTMLSWL